MMMQVQNTIITYTLNRGFNLIFVDTGAFYESFIETAMNHKIFKKTLLEIKRGRWGIMVTTNYIVDELLTLIRLRVGHKEAISIGMSIKESMTDNGSIRMVWITPEIEELAWETFKQYHDKDFSFTDCTCFTIMDLFKIDTAFTADRKHFGQMGYQVIPEK